LHDVVDPRAATAGIRSRRLDYLSANLSQ
jgi:hypothetical protein